MEFTPFTVIAGVNAAGKSNLFDALQLLSRIAQTDNLKKAFTEQRGGFIELFTQYEDNNYATLMEFTIEMLVNRRIKDAWGGESDLKYTRLRYELKIERYRKDSGLEDLKVIHEHLDKLNPAKDKWIQRIPEQDRKLWKLKVTGKRAVPYLQTTEENGVPTICALQDGNTVGTKKFTLNNATRTVLSSFDSIDFPHLLAAKEEMKNWQFLQLNPEDLRQPTSKHTGEDTLSPTGKNLAATLYRISQTDSYALVEISRRLNQFLPGFTEVAVIEDNENKQYLIKVKDAEHREFSSRVLSEGTLRILALCILEQDPKHSGLLCFEEPENGVHPFRIDTLLQLLKALASDFTDPDMPLRQIIVNTHSPVLVGNLKSGIDSKNINIWYAEIKTSITNLHGKRMKLRTTEISPVSPDPTSQLELSERQRKLTSIEVEKYLRTLDMESNFQTEHQE